MTSSTGTLNFYYQGSSLSPSTSVAANTIQFLGPGSSPTVTPFSGGTFAINGILSTGAGTLTFATGTGTLTAGTGSTNELIIGGPQNVDDQFRDRQQRQQCFGRHLQRHGHARAQRRQHVYRPMTINSGIVTTNNFTTVGTAQGIGEGATLRLNGGEFEYNGGSGTYEQNNANGGTTLAINVGPAGGTLYNNSGNNYFSYNGVITGSGSLTFLSNPSSGGGPSNNQGQWFIEAASPSFTGNIIIGNASGTIAGNVQFRPTDPNSVNPFGTGTIIINPTGLLSADSGNYAPSYLTNNIILNGGWLGSQGYSMIYSGAVTLNATTSTIASFNNASVSETMNGPIGGSGGVTVGVSTETASTVYFTNLLSYTGVTNVAYGTLQIGNGTTTPSETLATSGISLAGGTMLAFDIPSGGAISYANSISGTSGTMNLIGAGTVNLGGTVGVGSINVGSGSGSRTSLIISGGSVTTSSSGNFYVSTNSATSGTVNVIAGRTKHRPRNRRRHVPLQRHRDWNSER